MDKNKGFCMFFDWVEDLNNLDPAQAWKIVCAFSEYYQNGVDPLPKFDSTTRVIVSMMMHQVKRLEAKAEAGRKGAMITNTKSTADRQCADSMPTADRQCAIATKTKTNTKTKTDTKTDTNTLPLNPPPGDERARELEERFERFWKAYPRHEGKQNALKAFVKLKPDEALTEVIITAVEGQKLSKQWETPQYIPHPSTWLNGRRWEDETEEQIREALKEAKPKNFFDDFF